MNRKQIWECIDELQITPAKMEKFLSMTHKREHSGGEYMELQDLYYGVQGTLERALYQWNLIRKEGEIL